MTTIYILNQSRTMATSPRFSFIETNTLAQGDGTISIQSVIDSSEALAEEAREVLPYSFDECTYAKGYLRQAIWSCIDCNGKGVCYGCSIACHSGESHLFCMVNDCLGSMADGRSSIGRVMDETPFPMRLPHSSHARRTSRRVKYERDKQDEKMYHRAIDTTAPA